VFTPMMMQQRGEEREDNRFQQRLAAELERDRRRALAKAQEPPQFVQNLQAYMQMPDDMKRQYLNYLDNTQPIAVSGPMGTQRVPRSLGGPPPEAVGELKEAVSQGDREAIAEFEAVFGPGSASRYLGQ
jgi:hypothetical protein